MARKLFGAALIAFAFLLVWATFQPDPMTNIRRKHKNSWVSKTIHLIQKAQPFSPKPSALCLEIQDLSEVDETLESYRPRLAKVTLLSQIQDEEVKMMLEKCLAVAFPSNPKIANGYEMEIDVFDTSNAPTANHNENTRAWKTGRSLANQMDQNLVLQFSFLDSQTANKVAEAAMTISYDIIEKSRPHDKRQK